MSVCRVLVVGQHGVWWGWCPVCRWEGPSRSIEEMARLDGQHHTGPQRPDPVPPWARGPGAA